MSKFARSKRGTITHIIDQNTVVSNGVVKPARPKDTEVMVEDDVIVAANRAAAEREGRGESVVAGVEENDTDTDTGSDGDEAQSLTDLYGERTATALEEAGYSTQEQLDAASDEDLDAIEGIGQATIDKIRGRA